MIKISTLNKFVISRITFLVLINLAFFSSDVLAEGTKELRPQESDAGYITYRSSYNEFAQYGCSEEERLHIKICNVGEVIYYGMQSREENNRKWQLRDPNGNIIITDADIPKSNTDIGYIDTYNEAVIGPAQITTGGYNAMSFTTTAATGVGDYYLEFDNNNEFTTFEYIDVTVADVANGNPINGRLWSKAWSLSTGSFADSFEGTLFMYSNDQIVTALDFNGIRPYVFVITANPTGVNTTGNFTEDRKSVYGYEYYAEYKIFLNDPDINCYPTGEFGSLTMPSTVTGCGNEKCINIFSDKAGSVLILLDFNAVSGYQANTEDIQLAQDVVAGMNCVPWNSYDGLGDFVGNGTSFDLQVDYLNGITHLPMTDVEKHLFGYSVSLVRPIGNAPKIFWDDTKITNSSDLTGCNGPCHTWSDAVGNNNTINTWWYANIEQDNLSVVNINLATDANVNTPGSGANNDTTICENTGAFNLFGEVVGATGGQWTTSGDGTFSSPTNQTGTYTPGTLDYANGVRLTLTSTGNPGVCPAESDFMDITFSDAPTMTVGPPQTVCENDIAVTLTSSFTIAGGMEWIGGTGIFVPSRFDPNPVYTPSANETTAGTVTLTAQTTNNGLCNPASNNVIVTIETAPIVDAGSPGGPQSVCNNNNMLIQLAGTFSNATQVTWSGAGIFSDINSPTSTYQPTATELANTSFSLTLTTDAPGTCLAETSQIDFTVFDSPIVEAGSAILSCTNADTIQLAGSITNSSGVTWSGGNGVFIPNNTDLNAQYELSTSDKSSSSITLYLTSFANGLCSPKTDSVTISMQSAPLVTISSTDQAICANNPEITASVNVNGSSGGIWSGGTGTYTPNINSTSIIYTPSTSEIVAKFSTLIFTATDLAGCNSVTDTLETVISPQPIVLAGGPQSICKNNTDISLNGIVILADNSSWIGEAGSFTSSPIDNPNNTYQPNQSDLDQGMINLVLVATKVKCNPVYDTVTITFTDMPTIIASPDQTICANSPSVSLNSTFTIASGIQWSGGSNNFSNATSTNTTYTPSASEISQGTAQIYAVTTGSGGCIEVTDTVNIIITPSPTVDAGDDQTVCFNNAKTTTLGILTVATQGIWSGGSGNYQSNENDLSLKYTPTRTEKESGSVTLTLTSTDNGNCLAVSSQMIITVEPKPSITNFGNKSICGNESVSYSINLSNATGISISGGNGTFTPNNTSTSFAYTPSATEILAGTVDLAATTTGNGDCKAVNKTKRISIQAIPTVNAGSDLIVCNDISTINLNGSSANVASINWSTSGSGTFGNNNLEITNYTPSTTDLSNGSVTLTLLGNANAQCNDVSDQMILTFNRTTSVVAGPNQTVCSNSFPVLLGASGSPATWSGGNGNYSPNSTSLNAQYTPTDTELTAGTITLTVSTQASGACPSITDDVTISLIQGPVADAGDDQIVCSNNNISLSGTIINSTGGFWTTNGTGNFSSTTDVFSSYTPSTNDAHLTDTSTIEIYLSTTGSSPCPIDTDTILVQLAPTPVINAGPDQTICADLSHALNGSFTNTTGVTWTGGAGTYSDSNNPNSIYTPSSSEVTAGFVILTLTSNATAICPIITDDLTISFTPTPIATVGNDITVCADTAFIRLSGSVANATSAQWFSTGTGIFSLTSSAINTDYYPSASDTATGLIQLWMESTGNGICTGSSDTLIIILNPAPVINAGPDQTLCSDVSVISLTGELENVTQGIWTSNGTGTFANENAINTTYTLGVVDASLTTLSFTFNTVDHGICKKYNDQMLVSLTGIPTVNAGFTQTLCADTSEVQLNASFTISGGIQWSASGTGSFFPNNTDINAKYLPNSADTTLGNVTIIISTTQNGLCNIVEDSVIINFTPVPTVFAGVDHIVCADTSTIQLMSSAQNTMGITWSTNGSGSFFSSQFEDTVQYQPSNADTAARAIEIYLTSDADICKSVVDVLTINITPQPHLTIGPDQTVCANTIDIPLLASVTNATGVAWTTSGTGIISDTSLFTPTYTPSLIDTLAGGVTLTITSNGNNLCQSVSTSMQLHFESSPIVDAGTDILVCAENTGVVLNARVANATSGFWTSTGTGTFGPDTLTVDATYYPAAADTVSKSITLILTSITSSVCENTSDTVNIQIQPLPIANAGADLTACADLTKIRLNGAVTNALTGQWSLLNGSGIISDAADLTAYYSPSVLDTTNGSVTLMLQTVGNGDCVAIQDTIEINIAPEPTVFAGNDLTICSNEEFINLAGTSSNSSFTTWTTNGSGSLINEKSLNTVYALGNGDSLQTQITFTLTTTDTLYGCTSKTDNITLSLTPFPTVDAGQDLTVCSGITSVPLSGVIQNATGGRWAMVNATTGSFSPTNNQLITTYLPTNDDFTNGSVLLRLYSTGNGECLTNTDELLISFSSTPRISAGGDETVCKTDMPYKLQGALNTGVWQGGLGTFTPNRNTSNALYQPDQTELDAGFVNLTRETNNNGNCIIGTDDVTINFVEGPSVTANPRGVTDICSTDLSINLNGNLINAGGSTWSTTGTGTFDRPTDVNTNYNPTASDQSSGSVILELKTTNNGLCNAQSDFVTLSFRGAPTVFAGTQRSICADNPTLNLAGSYTNGTGVSWSGGTASNYTNITSEISSYTASSTEINNGSVTLTLSASGYANCNPVNDDILITILPIPIVSINNDTTVCASRTSFQLDGVIQNALGGRWTSDGSGTFSPSENSLDALYIPSEQDITNGSVNISLFTEGNGLCDPVNNSFILTFQQVPQVNTLSPTIDACENETAIAVASTITGANGVLWSSAGTGVFSDPTTDNTTYIPSASDIATRSVLLIISTTGNGTCDTAKTTLTMDFSSVPTVNAGLDFDVCANETQIQLNGQFTIATNATWNAINGSGSFTPNETTMNAAYQPTASDTAQGFIDVTLTTDPTICPSQSDIIRVNLVALPIVNAGDTLHICDDTTVLAVIGQVSNATGGEWVTSGNGSFSTSSLDLSATYVMATEDYDLNFFGLTLTNTGNNLCPKITDALIIQTSKAPNVPFIGSIPACTNATDIHLNITAENENTILWSTLTAGTFSDQTALSTFYQPSSIDRTNGYINLIITTTGFNTCMPSVKVIQVQLQDLPVINAGPDQEYCANNAIALYEGKISYGNSFWTTGGGGRFEDDMTDLSVTYFPSASDTANGNLTLYLNSMSDGVCSSIYDSLIVTLTPQPYLTPSKGSLCALSDGVDIDIMISNNNPGLWSTAGTGTFSPNNGEHEAQYYPSQSDFNSGAIDVTFSTDLSLGCNPIYSTMSILLEPEPIANAGKDLFTCRNGTLSLTSFIEEDVSYSWGTTTGDALGNNASVSFQVPSDLSIILTATDDKGCVTTDTMQVGVYELPTFNLPPLFCYNDTLSLDADPQNTPNVPGTFQWYKNDILQVGQNTPIYYISDTGEFSVSFAYQSCSIAASSTVHALPVISSSDEIGCIGELINITTTESINFNYIWSDGVTNLGTGYSKEILTLKDTNQYYVTVTDQNSCISIDSLLVLGLEKPITTLSDTSVCSDQMLLLSPTVTNYTDISIYSPVYSWYHEDVNLATSTEEQISLEVTENGTYIFKIIIGQCVASDSSVIKFNPLPISQLSDDDLVFCDNDTIGVLLDAGVSSKYFWTPTNDTTRTTLATEEQMYYVELTNQFGCQSTDSVFVSLICVPILHTPNAFTPGIEGGDQYFKVFGKHVVEFDLTIYSRWGEVIFHTNDINEGWDGIFMGEEMPIGTYPWVIRYKGRGEFDQTRIESGSVTLLK